jgi:hypothetical protein
MAYPPDSGQISGRHYTDTGAIDKRYVEGCTEGMHITEEMAFYARASAVGQEETGGELSVMVYPGNILSRAFYGVSCSPPTIAA